MSLPSQPAQQWPWVEYPTLNARFRWDRTRARYFAEELRKECKPQGFFQLRPTPPEYEYFWQPVNEEVDPFMECILAWARHKGVEALRDSHEGAGGWELWVRNELHAFFSASRDPALIPHLQCIWREARLYELEPGQTARQQKMADLLLHMQEGVQEPRSAFFELKCECFDTTDLKSRVEQDLKKIRDKKLKKIGRTTWGDDNDKVNQPCHAYAVVLTFTEHAAKAMRDLGMTEQPCEGGLSLWWHRTVFF
ncbi:hypothetical protein SLS58_003089 [Diplodia intermedia]|uniref:Uncharacterized protein n=1 Tax=Diplodia intermedia TaxID=856260 RepID=A0ABR3TYB0_9PEZI